ncbi:hypothetical protein D6783_03220 [Candidatus Woesearchaeota archaeon]|nr:MAG: hypothetical protein D6783_03220 [Candidatus Woesearchaeota archaeon]
MRRKALTQRRINETLRLLKITSRYVNHIRLHRSTSPEHMRKICEICIWLRQNNKDFVTEAEFITGGRADIVVLEDQIAIEVAQTETKERFNKKDYPIMKMYIATNEPWRGI